MVESAAQASAEATTARRLRLGGRVQGIGYRPALARLALAHGLVGWVANTSAGIEVYLQGVPERVEAFLLEVVAVCPDEGDVASVQVDVALPLTVEGFCIVVTEGGGGLATPVPRDVVTCADCRREMGNTQDRRYRDVMISCSRCGPRYTLLTAMPYERPTTSMLDFDMCPACWSEYRDVDSRRFHAQTTSCPICGPRVTGWTAAVDALKRGEVVALQGVGGFQWLVSARSSGAIHRLRQLKRRPQKPLAIMVQDLEMAGWFGIIESPAARALASTVGPIVVVPQRRSDAADARGLSAELRELIAPGLDSIGLFLPSTGMHAALVSEVGPLVVSSANWEGDPICYNEEQLSSLRGRLESEQPQAALSGSQWRVLSHNRVIQRPLDDSVVQVMSGHLATIRLGRGLGPQPLELGAGLTGYAGLAVGGQQKVAIALSNGQQAILGPHVGDMESLAARRRFVEHVDDLLSLYDCCPQFVAHDRHPDYFTTRWAEEFAAQRGIPAIAVQHHAAHVATSLLDRGWVDRDVLTIAWDGTGYGDDGTVWGGEAFVYTPRAAEPLERVARLQPFLLPGGAWAVRQPWRVAASLLYELGERATEAWRGVPRQAEIEGLLSRRLNCVGTSSVGRLFDAVAVLVLGAQRDVSVAVGYEGQFAACLEAVVDLSETGWYDLPLQAFRDAAGRWEWDWRPLVRQLLQDRTAGATAGQMAMRFHRGLARGIAALGRHAGVEAVTLAGGVFQNRRLVELVATELAGDGIEVGLPGELPVNDGGLAAGQLWWASRVYAGRSQDQQTSS